MIPLYAAFYRDHGIRRQQQLTLPPLAPLDTLNLPQDSILHYLPEDDVEYGIPADHFLLQDPSRVIMVEHPTVMIGTLGPPRNTNIQALKLIRDYHTRFRKLRLVRNRESALRDHKTILVESYGVLNHLYRYTTSFFSGYYKWANVQTTLWDNVNKLAVESQRQQYLTQRLPQRLPSVMELIKAENNMTRDTMRPFVEAESLAILDLWRWLGKVRHEALLDKLSPDAYGRMNLVFVESGRWFTLNLGLLDEWRKHEDGDEIGLEALNDSLGLEAVETALDASILQKRFLRLLMSLFETRTVANPDPKPSLPPVVGDATVTAEPGSLPTPTPVPTSAKASSPPEDIEEGEQIEAASGADEVEHRNLDAELATLDRLNAVADEVRQRETPAAYQERSKDLVQGVMGRADELAEVGLLSAAEYRRIQKLSTKYKEMRNPFGEGTLEEHLVIKREDLVLIKPTTIPDIKGVVDKSMLTSSLLDFDSRYISNVLTKDVANAVMAMQKAGVAVAGFEVERVEDVMNKYDAYTIRLAPVAGAPSTVRFRLPVVNEDGTFLANGIKMCLRKQRGDMPIRKAGANRVAMTSYYCKTFVNRSERMVNNYPNWLTTQLVARGVDRNDESVTNFKMSNVYGAQFEVPRVYSIIARKIRSFSVGEFDLFFDYARREAEFGAERLKQVERDGLVVCGRKGRELVLIDNNNTLYVTGPRDLHVVGTIEDLVGLDIAKAPIEIAEAKMFNKYIPVGLVLGYEMGLTNLMKALKIEPRRVPRGERASVAADEYAVQFADETLVFPRQDKKAALVLAGFNQYAQTIRNYNVDDFDRKDVYYNVLENNGIGIRYIREIDNMFRLWVDHITEGLLEEMGEPTDYGSLLMRACEMLLTDYHPAETDLNYMRIKGYERFAGAVYGELSRALRIYNARPLSSKVQVEVNPHAVWQTIVQDPAINLANEINPIHNLKEKEVVTYGGTGGRSGRSMVKRTRAYDPSDMGTISEGTVDSSDVGVISYLSANPQFNSLRGTSTRYQRGVTGASSLISTAALLSPSADNDDPKRVNFINIQQSHGIAAVGYRPTALRTGYERVIAHRADDLFAYTAKQDGVVEAKDDKHIRVRLADGSVKAVELGRRFGVSAGLTLPHLVVSELNVGDTFKSGDTVSYNQGFFEPDPLDPKQVLWKAGVTVTTAICENTDTLEDSSVISDEVAELLSSQTTNIRNITLRFDQSVRNLVRAGTVVDIESILCTIEDPITADTNLFDDDALDTLRVLANQTPRAKYAGTVEKVEVLYNGDKEDMSESLRTLANASDRFLGRVGRALGRETTITGQVDSALRVEGNPLEMDTLVIKVYITGTVAAGVGDKGVFGNQMKTIFGRIMSGENTTEDGEKIGAIFGYQSISDRIVLSPEVIGTTTVLLDVIGKLFVDTYRGRVA